ncbi:methylmalonyl Co-A mutase-associated GTPase MeaB [bacterium 3DAC]|nr:methylmalonyl Co-A mutase-associated GTPase MeaB [Dictyoglomota bacterium]UZN22930.1 methylmalonyl Co-A mutase-associated GTPase MeaB [bacterium 3DAC]
MSKKKRLVLTEEEVFRRLIQGDEVGLARALSMIYREEATSSLLSRIYAYNADKKHKSKVIGITGAGGVGKSTLISVLAEALLKKGLRIGIIAVDPSSPKTGGALLGDRIRLQHLFPNPNLFFRSFSSRGMVGGINPFIFDAVAVLEAASFDYIIIETLGIGQDEIDIVHMCDLTALVIAPGLGDDVQFLKSGVIELVDLIVMNKSDLPTASRTVGILNSYTRMVENHPDIIKLSAYKKQGIMELIEYIDNKWQELLDNGSLEKRRMERWKFQVGNWMRYIIGKRIHKFVEKGEVNPKASPYEIAISTLKEWGCEV